MVFTGNGKGKTSAAMGVALRAAGQGLKTLMIQFIRDRGIMGSWTAPGCSAEPSKSGRWARFRESGRPEARPGGRPAGGGSLADSGRSDALGQVRHADSGRGQLRDALRHAARRRVLAIWRKRPAPLHVIATGRNAPAELIEAADLVSEIKEIKHPFHRACWRSEDRLLMPWFTREKSGDKKPEKGESKVRTEGLWFKCDACRQIIWKKTLEESLHVCPKCGFHFRVGCDDAPRHALRRPWKTFDAGLVSTTRWTRRLQIVSRRLAAMQRATKLSDAVISAGGTLAGRPVHICALELKFIGGSVGSVVGEVLTRAVERSIAQRTPLIVVSASGGMRMQEGRCQPDADGQDLGRADVSA